MIAGISWILERKSETFSAAPVEESDEKRKRKNISDAAASLNLRHRFPPADFSLLFSGGL
jgi:hypothetical protein